MQARDAEDLLEVRGIPATPRRVAVLQSLLKLHAPATAPEILRNAKALCAINKATLYRILDLFTEAGLALRHSAGERSFRYCATTPAAVHDRDLHCHFHCTQCGAMQCLDGRELGSACELLAREADGHVLGVEIRLDGLCRQCGDAGAAAGLKAPLPGPDAD